MKIVVTDAYSTTNVGDAELVRLTLESVLQRFGVQPIVLATDPKSFDGFDGLFVAKPLSRFEWRRRSRLRRAAWLPREFVQIVALIVIPFVPVRLRASLASRVGRVSSTWLKALISADRVVGVGGGYLGDRYLRESILSAWSYRLATSLNIPVETMPISITSIDSWVLRRAILGARGVQWRAREEVTLELLRGIGVSAELVPDLAWLDTADPIDRPRNGLIIAPVGSAFYTAQGDLPRVWQAALEHVRALPPGGTVRLVPMHTWSSELGDGGDDAACRRLSELIRKERPDVTIDLREPGSYREVREAMSESAFAICERLHAALAALTTATPVAVVAYEPKHGGVLRLAGLDLLATAGAAARPITAEELSKAASDQYARVYDAVMT